MATLGSIILAVCSLNFSPQMPDIIHKQIRTWWYKLRLLTHQKYNHFPFEPANFHKNSAVQIPSPKLTAHPWKIGLSSHERR